jgi:hypothetical protein
LSVTDEYLTIAEVAARLKLTPKTVRNRMHDGTWRQGQHWFSPRGIAPRFRWSALVAWLEAPPAQPASCYGIPRARRGRPPHGAAEIN